MLPRISLVTPNLNYAQTLARTIDSVLDQGYPALDYVVMDGGSTDDSLRILQGYSSRKLRLQTNPDHGQYPVINQGFALTTGEIMGWVNSDDILLPWTLRTVAEIFSAFPDVDWIMGSPAVIQDDAIHEVAPPRPRARALLQLGLYAGGEWGLVQQESCFWRRRLWERAGPLREDLRFAADYELWTRFAQHAELIVCAALLGGFTIHGSNRSRVNGTRYRDDIARVVAGLPPSLQTQRARLERWYRIYSHCRPLTGLKGLVRRASGLAALDGPVVRRDFATRQYVLTRELVFP